jgi:two-component system response regulator PilR (NtrC family)
VPDGEVADDPLQALIGESPAMQQVRAMIEKLARSQAPIYVSGESGSGKELAARLIHARSARSAAPFVPVNCGAIPENLMESEFFGHRKGAFTGADSDRDGFFQAASGGTLFLDEVADLPLAMQVKLLRAIQEKRCARSARDRGSRSMCASSAPRTSNLREWSTRAAFRQDLYYRLNVIELRMPPLRERLEDIPPLVDSVLPKLFGGKTHRELVDSGPEGAAAILSRAMCANWRTSWSGPRRCVPATADRGR